MSILLSSGDFAKLTSGEPSMTLLLAQRFENVAVVRLQLITVQARQTLPIDVVGIGDGLLNGGRLCSSAILRKSRNVNCSEPVLSHAEA
jgi:hypothetical protein